LVVAQDIVEREMEERKRRLAEERYWALKAEEAVLRQRAEAAIHAMEAERELRMGLIRLDTRGADTDLSHRRSPTRAPTRLHAHCQQFYVSPAAWILQVGSDQPWHCENKREHQNE
jgi:hypothetical protein